MHHLDPPPLHLLLLPPHYHPLLFQIHVYHHAFCVCCDESHPHFLHHQKNPYAFCFCCLAGRLLKRVLFSIRVMMQVMV